MQKNYDYASVISSLNYQKLLLTSVIANGYTFKRYVNEKKSKALFCKIAVLIMENEKAFYHW